MKKIFLFSAAVLMSVGMSAQLAYNAVYSEEDFNDPNTTVFQDKASWADGVKLSNTGTNWDARKVIIQLAAGIPDTLYFTCKQNLGISTGMGFRVRQGASLETMDDVIKPGLSGTSAKKFAVKLDSTTRFISLDWGGNFTALYSNVYVSPATTYGEETGSYCQGGAFEYNDTVYTEGVYEVKLENYFGGDSIVTLTVTENPVYETLVVDTMVYGETKEYYPGYVYTADTVGEVIIDSLTFTTVAGCDSTFYFKMVINKAEQEISWNIELIEDTIALYVGDSIEDLAFADSELELTYIMSKDSVVAIENNVLVAIAADTVVVAPMQEGNQFYNAVFGTEKVFIVAEKPAALINAKAEAVETKKMIVNGQVVIIRNGKAYNALGAEIF